MRERESKSETENEREGTEEEGGDERGREWQAYYNSSMWITLVDWEQSLVEIVF